MASKWDLVRQLVFERKSDEFLWKGYRTTGLEYLKRLNEISTIENPVERAFRTTQLNLQNPELYPWLQLVGIVSKVVTLILTILRYVENPSWGNVTLVVVNALIVVFQLVFTTRMFWNNPSTLRRRRKVALHHAPNVQTIKIIMGLLATCGAVLTAVTSHEFRLKTVFSIVLTVIFVAVDMWTFSRLLSMQRSVVRLQLGHLIPRYMESPQRTRRRRATKVIA